MNIEIERKFLVDQEAWKTISKPEGTLVMQGYIFTSETKSIRVRTMGSRAYLTIKGKTNGAARDEFEYEIPLEDAKLLLANYSVALISKVRYRINYRQHLWEVDEFLQDNEGLIIAEIELTDENEVFETPAWVGTEVTDDSRYYNSSLSVNPVKRW